MQLEADLTFGGFWQMSASNRAIAERVVLLISICLAPMV
jgi:hypothetical protein